MVIPDHLTCLLRNLYAGQEARDMEQETGCKLGKEYVKAIKIAGEKISNLRCADDTTLMSETKEEPKNLLMKVKEESEKDGLKLNIQKTKIMASGPITSWKIDGKTVTDFLFLGMSLSKLREVVRDREAWRAAVHGVTKSRTRLSN